MGTLEHRSDQQSEERASSVPPISLLHAIYPKSASKGLIREAYEQKEEKSSIINKHFSERASESAERRELKKGTAYIHGSFFFFLGWWLSEVLAGRREIPG